MGIPNNDEIEKVIDQLYDTALLRSQEPDSLVPSPVEARSFRLLRQQNWEPSSRQEPGNKHNRSRG